MYVHKLNNLLYLGIVSLHACDHIRGQGCDGRGISCWPTLLGHQTGLGDKSRNKACRPVLQTYKKMFESWR